MRDGELVNIARDFRQGVLGTRPSVGMCKVVCAPLQGYLAALHGLETAIEEVNFGFINHVYLRLPDGRILDPTADQFSGMPDVYLGPWPEAYEQMVAGAGALAEHSCEDEDCKASAQPYWLPDSDQAGEPDAYLCAVHAHRAGWCWGCGGFYAGVEWFDFQSRTGLCENCEPGFLSEIGEGEDWDWEEGDYYWDDPDGGCQCKSLHGSSRRLYSGATGPQATGIRVARDTYEAPVRASPDSEYISTRIRP